MRQFDYRIASSVEDALQNSQDGAHLYKAGGVDVLDRLKEGLERPAMMVGLQRALEAGFAAPKPPERLARLGAAITLAELAAHPEVGKHYPALAQSAGEAATPQVRTMATLGGNLLQRPRCWYFRSRHYECLKKGGSKCWAQDGLHDTHALFDNDLCAVVHASNAAPALIALNAVVELHGAQGPRRAAVRELYTKASEDPTVETTLQPGEILTAVLLPEASAGRHSAHYEVRHKQSFDWPLAIAAVNLNGDAPCLVLGAVASTPLWFDGRERGFAAWRERPPRPAELEQVVEEATRAATPLARNAWRLPLIKTAIRRALLKAAGVPEEQW